MTPLDGASALLSITGVAFYIAGTVGLLRFPDTFTRLHALTKADNLGLAFIVLAMILQSTSFVGVAKLILIWLLALLVGSSACFLIGRWAIHQAADDGAEGAGDE